MIKFDNSFFFSRKYLNLKKNTSYQNCLKICASKANQLNKEYQNGVSEILNSFRSEYQKKVELTKKKISYKNKKTVVIGMGGSSSGAKAISSYLGKDIIYFDNLDYKYFFDFFKKKNIFEYNYFIISKSGDTFETLALCNLLIKNIFKKKKKYVLNKIIYIITEDTKSPLNDFAKRNNISIIEHNKNIGGRYSALSETALLPINVNYKNITKATEYFLKLLKNNIHNLSPITNSSIIFYFWKYRKFNTYVNLIYDYRLKDFSYWFHQLHAESLGKKKSGLLPFTSICPKDHHSMMQLFLEGPKDKIFNIFKPPQKKYEKFAKFGLSNIEAYNPSLLLEKQFKATVESFKKNKIPHRIIELNEINKTKNIFQLISYFILETIILGYSARINPYDQPAVKQIKDKIFKI